MKAMAMLPSPTPLDTRLMELWRTSPAANTPGRLVSNGNGGRSGFQVVRSRPVQSPSSIVGSQFVLARGLEFSCAASLNLRQVD